MKIIKYIGVCTFWATVVFSSTDCYSILSKRNIIQLESDTIKNNYLISNVDPILNTLHSSTRKILENQKIQYSDSDFVRESNFIWYSKRLKLKQKIEIIGNTIIVQVYYKKRIREESIYLGSVIVTKILYNKYGKQTDVINYSLID